MLRWLFSIGLSFSFFLPAIAQAQISNPCTYVGGCSPVAGRAILWDAIQMLASFFTTMAAGGAVLFVIFGGMMMLLSFGDDTKITKGKNSIIYALVGFALVMAAQVVVGFAVARLLVDGMQGTAFVGIQMERFLVRVMMQVFNVMFVLVMVVAGVRMVLAQGKSDEFTKGKNMLLWAVIGALIVNLSHALVRGIFLTGFGGVTGVI